MYVYEGVRERVGGVAQPASGDVCLSVLACVC